MTKGCGQKKVEIRAQGLLGHNNGQTMVEKRAQGLLSQHGRDVKTKRAHELLGQPKEKRVVKPPKNAVLMSLSLLLWCLPFADACSATCALDVMLAADSSNHSSPVGFCSNVPLGAVPWCGGLAPAVVHNGRCVADSNGMSHPGFIDGVIYGLMPPNDSFNPPKTVWVLILLTSMFSSIWLGGL